MSDTKTLISKMTLTALMTALCYVITAFLPITYGNGGGYFNFGDICTLFTAISVGPIYGMFVGAVAGSMADLTLGGLTFIPFTIVAKSVMALVAGFLYPKFNKKLRFIPILLGAILMALCYLPCYLINFGTPGWVSFGFDLVQASVASIGSYLVVLFINEVYMKTRGKTLYNR